MKIVLQRVARAEVRVGGEVVARIGRGVLLLLGVEREDGEADLDVLARKVLGLRVFPGRTPLDLTLSEVGGACLLVSQFTLAADLAKGNRPGFSAAEAPGRAEALYLDFAQRLGSGGLPVRTGRFGALMEVELVNDGPVTLLLRSRAGRLVDA